MTAAPTLPASGARRFHAPHDQARAERILERVRGYDWDAVPDAGGSSAGIDRDLLQRICARWTGGYEWSRTVERLNRFPQFLADIDGQRVHFLHVRGSNPRPLLLCHGWPGSTLEFDDVIERLAFPDRFGGKAQDGFDVIVPSLPGYGYSGRPAAPIGPRRTAALFDTLMTKVLGYPQYTAQGGDWGSAVTAWMAHDFHQHTQRLHLNMVLVLDDGLNGSEEGQAYLAARQRIWKHEGGYAIQQATRPQTLAFALADSPVGTMAWIADKFAAWSDQTEPDLLARFPVDHLISNVMLYLMTGSVPTSMWMYKGFWNEGSDRFPPGPGVRVPTAVAAFPDPVFAPPPRHVVERAYDLRRWTDMPRGGHFAAMEAPDLFVRDIADFVRATE